MRTFVLAFLACAQQGSDSTTGPKGVDSAADTGVPDDTGTDSTGGDTSADSDTGGGVDSVDTHSTVDSGTDTASDTDLDTADAEPDSIALEGGADDAAGASVAGVGDVDGDGFDDVLIGTYRGWATWSDAGRAYLVLGSTTPTAIDLSAAATATYAGEGVDDRAGSPVAGAGDVDGDGLADLLVGAAYAGVGEAGCAYLILGSASPADGELAAADAAYAGAPGDEAGTSLAGAGDVNGDGFADFLVGAPARTGGAYASGAAYLILGSATPTSRALSSADAEYSSHDLSHAAGTSLDGAGDVDGDGLDDVVIGAPGHQSGTSVLPMAFLVLGTGTPASEDLSASIVYVQTTDYYSQLGESVAGLGDVNGDGFADLGIGDSGVVHLVLGGATMSGGDLPGAADASWSGGDGVGGSVAGGGDVDHDGLADSIIGDRFAAEGHAYIVLGRSAPVDVDLTSSADADYVGLDMYEQAGASVDGAGDVDGDGFGDVLVGAWAHGDAGAAYLFFGGGA